MMFGLSKLATWLMGSAAIPALLVGCLVLGGNVLASRRAALIQQGEAKCEAKWEIDLAKAQRDMAIADARALQAQINATDVLNMELKANAADIEQKYSSLRSSLADADQRCISDGVRELARGVQERGGGEERPVAKGRQRKQAP